MLNSRFPPRSLGTVADIYDARRIPVKATDRQSGPYPYYGAQGIVDYINDYIFDGEYILVAEDGENLRSRKEDIALLASGKFWVNNHAHIIHANNEADNRFLYYALNAIDISGYITGSTIPKLSQKALRSLRIPFPSMHIQKNISSMLSALDAKIELNRQITKTLEAMAQTIFKDWFVDFGPVRAKLARRDRYLSRDIWDLFPDNMDSDEKPVTWQSFLFQEIAELNSATTVPSQAPDTIFEHYSLPAYDAGQQPKRHYGSEIHSNKTYVEMGSILLSKLNPQIPRVWLPDSEGNAQKVASTEFLVVTPTAHVGRGFLYSLFLTREFRDILASLTTGTSTSHQRVAPKSLKRTAVVVAEPMVIEAFEEVVEPLLQRMLQARKETEELVDMRNLLLPKLISGDVAIRDAEGDAAEAV